MSGWNFSKFIEEEVSPFEKLFNVFKELIVYTSGDFDEAIEWLRELDKEYKLTDENYTIDDFVNDLLTKGYVAQEINPSGSSELLKISSKMEKVLRKYAMDKIFGKIKKSKTGNHLYYANNKEVKYVDCRDVKLPYFRNLINDVLNRSETACSQELTYLTMELAIKAQEIAKQNHWLSRRDKKAS